MNEINWNEKRVRNKTLLIVEGNHEKNMFIAQLLKSFPEININIEDVIVFKTNIYILLSKIKGEYGDDWYEQDINLPLLISQNSKDGIKYDKRNFTNIFLIFDYERHDPNFSEDGILMLQKYFSNSEDVGKLYLNYPMIESYMDFDDIIDANFVYKKVSTNVKSGNFYKLSIKNKIISKLVHFPNKIRDIMVEKFGVEDSVASSCVNMLLNETNIFEAIENMRQIIGDSINESFFNTLIYQAKSIILNYGFMENGYSYNSYMRYVLSQIAIQNVKKANYIKNGKYEISDQMIRDTYNNLDMLEILESQNALSSPIGENEVFVLNTSILILPDYNTNLVFP